MRFRDFVSDRLVSLVLFVVGTLLVLAVVYLSVLSLRLNLPTGDILYMFVLSVAAACLYLLIEYVRQRAYLRQLSRAADSARGEKPRLEEVHNIQSAVTREQQVVQELLHNQYKQYTDELNRYREQQQQQWHFANQWAHQMKTPVSVISLLVQHGGGDNAPDRALLDSIQEENERLAQGLDMMLSTVRLGRFELDMSAKQVDLVGLLRGMINEHKKLWIRTGIFPRIVCDTETFVVESDEKWIAFLFNQLITNAMKYAKLTDKPSKQLTILMESDGDERRVSVRDNGIGIPQHDLPRVFEPFFTGDNGRISKESTGMGLYLAKQICGKLGHTISISSQAGVGTTVRVTFKSKAITNVIKL